MKIYVVHSRDIDYINELYNPIKNSSVYENNTVIFPHESDKSVNSKEIIKEADLVIAEVSKDSIGMGIELGWAEFVGDEILCISKTGLKISSSLKYITNNFIEYEDSTDLVVKLENYLKEKEI